MYCWKRMNTVKSLHLVKCVISRWSSQSYCNGCFKNYIYHESIRYTTTSVTQKPWTYSWSPRGDEGDTHTPSWHTHPTITAKLCRRACSLATTSGQQDPPPSPWKPTKSYTIMLTWMKQLIKRPLLSLSPFTNFSAHAHTHAPLYIYISLHPSYTIILHCVVWGFLLINLDHSQISWVQPTLTQAPLFCDFHTIGGHAFTFQHGMQFKKWETITLREVDRGVHGRHTVDSRHSVDSSHTVDSRHPGQ